MRCMWYSGGPPSLLSYSSQTAAKLFYTIHTISTAVTGVINAGCYYEALKQSKAQMCTRRKQCLYAQSK